MFIVDYDDDPLIERYFHVEQVCMITTVIARMTGKKKKRSCHKVEWSEYENENIVDIE